MANRKSISKKTRFEVFKRDKFTCQYCGKSAPDAILQIDHITPVSKGGTNDIMNLVTSCSECNSGKSNIELDDDTAIKARKRQLDALAERREQIEMMYEWQKGLLEVDDFAVEKIADLVHELFGFELNDFGLKRACSYLRKYGFDETATAYRIAADQYPISDYEDAADALGKVGGILYNRSHKTCQQCVQFRGYYDGKRVICACDEDDQYDYYGSSAENCPDYESRFGD